MRHAYRLRNKLPPGVALWRQCPGGRLPRAGAQEKALFAIVVGFGERTRNPWPVSGMTERVNFGSAIDPAIK